MNEAAAEAICRWRYPEPYSIYNGSPRNQRLLVDPRNHYYAVYRGTGEESSDVVGFFCFGADAQVPGELDAEARRDSSILDVGLGMRPDLTGQGLGRDFVAAGLAFARETFAVTRFRLAVLTFNQRAIRVYERAGFRPGKVFTSETAGGSREFLMMQW